MPVWAALMGPETFSRTDPPLDPTDVPTPLRKSTEETMLLTSTGAAPPLCVIDER